MRNFKILMCVALFISLSFSTLAQKKQKKYEPLSEELLSQLASRDYTIDATTMLPRQFKSKSLVHDYYIEIKGDSLDCCLPFFGEAYKAIIGSEGLIFESIINEYEQAVGKKGQTIIKLGTRTREDYYNFFIEVFSNGYVSISVNCNNREGIDFMGKLREPEEEEEEGESDEAGNEDDSND